MCSPLNPPIIFRYSDDTMMAIVCLDDSDTHEQELGDGRSVSSSQPSPSTTSITESLHNTATSATSSCSGQESNQEQSILSQKHQHCRQHLLMDAVEDLVLAG